MRVDDAGALARAIAQIGRPSILKTRRFGYDGKGQVLVREGADLAVTFRTLGGVPAILEAVVPFSKEISVVAARGPGGEFAAYDVCENIHENHVLKSTRAPARLAPELAAEATRLTRVIADALVYRGVITVEMFVTGGLGGDDGRSSCSSTKSPRASIIPVTGPSTAPSPLSSSSISGPSRAGRSEPPAATAPKPAGMSKWTI